MDRYELRYSDYSLNDDQESVRDAFTEFYANEVPTTRVRAAEPLGYDEKLWGQLAEMGVASMALPSSAGGDDATLVDLVLVAEAHGGALAPAPLVEHVVATRLLAATSAAPDVLAEAATGGRLLAVALQPGTAGRQLVPAGAVVRDVIALDGDRLVLVTQDEPPPLAKNQGSTPLASWDLTAGTLTTLAEGPEAVRLHAGAVDEWKLLTASALVGLTQKALGVAVEFTKTRETMGVPIGSLQGVAFPLTDVATGIAGARNLILKAAWYLDNEPGARPDLVPAAFAYAAKVATHGATTSQHMQGGLGFTVEADASLYFLRAKGWSVLAGDPARDVLAVGDLLAAQH